MKSIKSYLLFLFLCFGFLYLGYRLKGVNAVDRISITLSERIVYLSSLTSSKFSSEFDILLLTRYCFELYLINPELARKLLPDVVLPDEVHLADDPLGVRRFYRSDIVNVNIINGNNYYVSFLLNDNGLDSGFLLMADINKRLSHEMLSEGGYDRLLEEFRAITSKN